MRQKQNATAIAADYCRRFKTQSTRAIARLLKRDEPLLFASENAARVMVQRVRDEAGLIKNNRYIAPQNKVERVAPKCWDKLPTPKAEFDDWNAVEIGGDMTALILSDIHIPYYHKSSLLAALEMGRKRECDLILLNGDIADHYAVSHWDTDPRRRKFADEVDAMRDFLETLRDNFPAARIIYKLGNHEERYERYMRGKCAELLGVDKFDFAEIYELGKQGVEVVRDMKPIRLGKLFVIHGHEYRFPIANPVNPARGLFLRAKTLALCGHFHQTSQHSERNLEQSVVSTWSTGCLANLHPEYRPLNNWNHGHAIVSASRDGTFEVENYRTIRGDSYR
jgi:predicted phosphodiesterase